MYILKRYLDPLYWKKVEIETGFWGTRLETNQKVTLDHQYEQIEETGRLDNFRPVAGKKKGEFQALLGTIISPKARSSTVCPITFN